ncbi:hypothetical protein Gotur_024602 [Gossypium turneri]
MVLLMVKLAMDWKLESSKDCMSPMPKRLVDIIGLLTVYSFANRVTSTVDLNVSYYSTATIQEHVEIESKVSANRGKRMHAVVEVRRKGNGEVIAIGKLRMALNKLTPQVSNL